MARSFRIGQVGPLMLSLRPLFLGILVVALVSGGGAAFARWSASGSGSGAAANGALLAVSLTPGSPSAGLYPGGQTSVVLTASNPNTTIVLIRSLALDTSQGTGGFSVDAGHSGCAVTALSFATQTNGGAGWSVPANNGIADGTLSITLTNALSMTSSAANACQGATFTVYLAAGP